jgi:signal transduction histidine kinase
MNLVGNAIKFTEKGGVTIRLSGEFPANLSPSADGARTYVLRGDVIDTGIGMTADEMPRLFRAFSQLDTSSTRRHGGTGLGLAISKRLCQLMHGDIAVESSPDRGSAFHFHLQMTTAKGDSQNPFMPSAEALRRSPAGGLRMA